MENGLQHLIWTGASACAHMQQRDQGGWRAHRNQIGDFGLVDKRIGVLLPQALHAPRQLLHLLAHAQHRLVHATHRQRCRRHRSHSEARVWQPEGRVQRGASVWNVEIQLLRIQRERLPVRDEFGSLLHDGPSLLVERLHLERILPCL